MVVQEVVPPRTDMPMLHPWFLKLLHRKLDVKYLLLPDKPGKEWHLASSNDTLIQAGAVIKCGSLSSHSRSVFAVVTFLTGLGLTLRPIFRDPLESNFAHPASCRLVSSFGTERYQHRSCPTIDNILFSTCVVVNLPQYLGAGRLSVVADLLNEAGRWGGVIESVL